jgi:hypothetical protein
MSTKRKSAVNSYRNAITAYHTLQEDITLENISTLDRELENLFKAMIREGTSRKNVDDAILNMKYTLRELAVALKKGNSAKVASAKSTLELMLQALKTPLPPKGGAKRKTRKTRKHKKVARK